MDASLLNSHGQLQRGLLGQPRARRFDSWQPIVDKLNEPTPTTTFGYAVGITNNRVELRVWQRRAAPGKVRVS